MFHTTRLRSSVHHILTVLGFLISYQCLKPLELKQGPLDVRQNLDPGLNPPSPISSVLSGFGLKAAGFRAVNKQQHDVCEAPNKASMY